MTQEFKSIRVDDRVIIGSSAWVVRGVYLSPDGNINTAGLSRPEYNEEYMVPLGLIPYSSIFRAVNHEKDSQG